MPAMTVFTECIRYLKDHMLQSLKNNKVDILIDHASIHWVLTVPAIWNDTAKQFMREAAVNVCFFNIITKVSNLNWHCFIVLPL